MMLAQIFSKNSLGVTSGVTSNGNFWQERQAQFGHRSIAMTAETIGVPLPTFRESGAVLHRRHLIDSGLRLSEHGVLISAVK
jgi:hypothetical protein